MSMHKPGKLVVDGNVEENWRVFRREFEEYITAAGLEDVDDERLVALLLNLAGADAHEILDNSDLTDKEKKSFEKVVQCFEIRFVNKTNVTEPVKNGAEAEKIADAQNFTDDTWMASHGDVRTDFRMKKTPNEFNNRNNAF